MLPVYKLNKLESAHRVQTSAKAASTSASASTGIIFLWRTIKKNSVRFVNPFQPNPLRV